MSRPLGVRAELGIGAQIRALAAFSDDELLEMADQCGFSLDGLVALRSAARSAVATSCRSEADRPSIR